MMREVIGTFALFIGVAFLTVLFAFNLDTIVSKQLDLGWTNYIAIAFLFAWVISSALVKIGMMLNRKEPLINRITLGLFICTALFVLLPRDTFFTDFGTLIKIFSLIFFIVWAFIDYLDFKYLRPTLDRSRIISQIPR